MSDGYYSERQLRIKKAALVAYRVCQRAGMQNYLAMQEILANDFFKSNKFLTEKRLARLLQANEGTGLG